MAHISKALKYVICISTIYILLTILQKLSRDILLRYYTLDDAEIQKLDLTEKEKKFLAEHRAKVAEQAKLNSADHSSVRGGDGGLVVREKSMIDRYFKTPVANLIKRLLEEFGIRSIVEKVFAAVTATVLSLDSFAIGAAIAQTSPYCHMRPDKEFMADLERELRKRFLSIQVTDCNSRFQFADQNLSEIDLTDENIKLVIGKIECDEGLLITHVNYIRWITCFLALILRLHGIDRNNAVFLILERIVELVKSGRMRKEVAKLLFQILFDRGILTPDFDLPVIPKLPELTRPLLAKFY